MRIMTEFAQKHVECRMLLLVMFIIWVLIAVLLM